MNIPALPLQTGEDEEGQTFEIIFSAKGWASPPTLHNRAAQGLDVRHLPSPSPCGRGEVFSLDIPFYRTRAFFILPSPPHRLAVGPRTRCTSTCISATRHSPSSPAPQTQCPSTGSSDSAQPPPSPTPVSPTPARPSVRNAPKPAGPRATQCA